MRASASSLRTLLLSELRNISVAIFVCSASEKAFNESANSLFARLAILFHSPCCVRRQAQEMDFCALSFISSSRTELNSRSHFIASW